MLSKGSTFFTALQQLTFYFLDDKLLVNGQAVAPEEMDSVEDEDPTVIDGVEQGDEMDETAEDPAPNGENYHLTLKVPRGRYFSCVCVCVKWNLSR